MGKEEKMSVNRDMNKEEKLKALDAALTQIEKAYGKGSVMKLGESGVNMNIETVPTGSISLDIALGLGGVPKGRIIEVYGPESSGKTTVALHMVAEVQKRGGIAGFIDAEHLRTGQVVVDVGIHVNEEGKLCGDVRFGEAEPVVEAITPVPGGVGTVTTSVLVSHVVEAAEKSV